jgi:hypothetical protein
MHMSSFMINSNIEVCWYSMRLHWCECLLFILLQQDVVLQVFFDKHIQKLIDVIASSCAPKGIARSTSGSAGVRTMVEQHSAKPETLLKICELLSFCALHHTNRMK